MPRWADKAAELKYIDDEQPDEGVVGDVASVLLLSHHRNRSSIGPPNADFLVGDPRSRGCDARRLTLRSGSPAPQQQQQQASHSVTSSAASSKAVGDDAVDATAALFLDKQNIRSSEEPACVCEASHNGSPATARKQLFAEENPFVCTTRGRNPAAGCLGDGSSVSPQGEDSNLKDSVAASPRRTPCQNGSACSCSEDEGNRTTSRESTPSASPCRLPRRHRGSLPIPGGCASSAAGGSLGDDSGGSAPPSPALSRSIPSSPVTGRKSRQQQLRTLLYSPLLLRRVRGGGGGGGNHRQTRGLDSSDEEGGQSGEEVLSDGFRDLESMQKAYIRKKLKKRHGKVHQQEMLPPSKPPPMYREFVLHNKAPLWNEVSQVYQLDFGGRVTQESAKNFQIEFKGNQVMQFGRIDGNAYTLDFQYPFSALQAFSVALANVTQRLK